MEKKDEEIKKSAPVSEVKCDIDSQQHGEPIYRYRSIQESVEK